MSMVHPIFRNHEDYRPYLVNLNLPWLAFSLCRHMWTKKRLALRRRHQVSPSKNRQSLSSDAEVITSLRILRHCIFNRRPLSYRTSLLPPALPWHPEDLRSWHQRHRSSDSQPDNKCGPERRDDHSQKHPDKGVFLLNRTDQGAS